MCKHYSEIEIKILFFTSSAWCLLLLVPSEFSLRSHFQDKTLEAATDAAAAAAAVTTVPCMPYIVVGKHILLLFRLRNK